MSRENEALRMIGDTYIKRIAEELRAESSRMGVNGTMNAGSWSNDSGIVTAYLSYYPSNDASQDSIDAVITLAPRDDMSKGMKLTADISWSNGDIIADIAECTIQFSTPHELLSEASRAYEVTSQAIAGRLKALLFAR